jgi:O-glycosyl hydrolase
MVGARILGLLVVSLIVTGCGGNSNTNTQTPPPPTVSATAPTGAATGVAVNSTLTATFSEMMDAATISATTFTLSGPSGTVAGTVTYSAASNTATFTPSASLSFSAQYTAIITTGAMSSSGAALTANYNWSFTTAAQAPAVSAVSPASGATGVNITTALTATFSEAMNSSTINGSSFTLTPQGGNAIAATVAYSSNGNVATLTPSSVLAYNTQYTATITTGVQSLVGTALAANYSWSFTTAEASAPAVTVVSPKAGATDVAIATSITATFNQAMTGTTINSSTFTLAAQGGGSVAGSVTYNSATQEATFEPAANLNNGMAYTATISNGVTASTGIPLTQNYVWSFTTVAAPVPTVTSTVPANGVTNVNVGNALMASFSQPMNTSTITASTFTLTGPGNTPIAGAVTYNSGSSAATLTPSSALAFSTSYTATITTGATSSAGAALASNYVWAFTTGANPNQVSVDFGTAYQTIRGFGGSTAWLGQLTTQQAKALFSPTSGLGLSILRVRIDPEGSASNNWATGEWTTESMNATEAKSANPNAIVFASPWTPPASMKTSSTGQPYYSGSPACSPGPGYCGGYLDSSNYAAYASYLENFVTYFANNGVNLYGISMQNEPDYSAENGENYESCSWTPQQMDAWVASLTANGATNPITTKLIMPESYNFNPAQSNPTLADPNAAGNVSIVAGHLYGVTPSYATNAEAVDKEVWMTEHYLSPAGSQPAIGDALALAEEIHNSMTVGNYNAYVYWWIWDNPNDGINYGLINSSTTNPAPTYYGDAIGQFSEFIQPGYVRVSATANPVSGVYVSAYTQSSPAHYVIVAINANTSSESLTFALNNGTVTSLTPYETSSTATIKAHSAVSVSSGQFNYTLPAQSIITFVQ